MIVGKPIKYFCGILNSKLFIHYLSMILAGDSYTYGAGKIFEKIPIPDSTETIQNELTEIIDKILNGNNLENEINTKVYSLYGLSDEEIAFIESK